MQLKKLFRYGFVPLIVCVSLCRMAAFSSAQQATATISALQEEVSLSIQGGAPISGMVGTVLHSGDSLWTHSMGSVRLNLSDGSKLRLGENSSLRFSLLENAPSKVRLELRWGRVRAILSPAYQQEGSVFDIHTPNASLGVRSSELDAEVFYDPNIQTTTVLAHEFDLTAISLKTGVELQIARGHSGIIRDGVIQELAQIITPPSLADMTQQVVLSSFSGEVLVVMQGKSVIPDREGLVLRSGDMIRTNTDASATLSFADGTLVVLGENSHIQLYSLTENMRSGARNSRLQILRGSLRTVLGSGYQAPGSSFTLQNEHVEVLIENTDKADVEFRYQPNSSVTTLLAHKADLLVTHLLTEVSVTIPTGHSGIIHKHVIQEVARLLPARIELPQTAEQASERQADAAAAETVEVVEEEFREEGE